MRSGLGLVPSVSGSELVRMDASMPGEVTEKGGIVQEKEWVWTGALPRLLAERRRREEAR